MTMPFARTTLVAAAAALFSTAVTAAPANMNRSLTAAEGLRGTDARQALLLGASFDAGLAAPSFVWAPQWVSSAPVAPVADARIRAERAARDYLRQQAGALGLASGAVDAAAVVDVHDTGRGPVIVRLEQRVGGVEVFDRRLSVLMTRDLQLVATSGYFAPAALAGQLRPSERLSAAAALVSAFADQGGQVSVRDLRSAGRVDRYEQFSVADRGTDLHLTEGLRARQVWFPADGALKSAWYVEFFAETRDGHDQHAFAYVIDAGDGSVLFRKNLTEHAEPFTYRAFARTTGNVRPFDNPLGTITSPLPVSAPGETIVRTSAVAELVTLTNSPFVMNDPWLADSATTTSGNNVNAYLDLNAPGGYFPSFGDIRPTTTATRTFDFPIAADVDPAGSDAQRAAAVNLFYLNNWLHDQWYDAGFDEASGNAQTDNYGRGGLANDAIRAEGQDYSGRNNANMSTGADGNSPRMQMYLFDGLPVGLFRVEAPAGIGEMEWNYAGFGPQTFALTDSVVAYTDASGTLTDACEVPTNAAALVGNIALLDRGNCDFVVKVKNAQNAGAVGVVVANNTSGTLTMGGTDATITIPSMMVSQDDGAVLRGVLGQGLTVTMQREASMDLDGTLDNEIISHEFFHYVSNRLVGNGSGLSNTQGGGMGEGWSDFASLMLTVLPGDTGVAGNAGFGGGYSVGSYVLGDYYYGIRRTPYSTDFGKDPLTYKHIVNGEPLPTTAPIAYGQDGASNAEVHNTGEIWANTLWEVYAGLLNDGRYSYTQARARMADYVVSTLKMTPSSPTLLEARDAWLAVALATDAQDYRIVATAFAKRGMGVNAVAANRNSSTNEGAVEDFQAAAGTSLGATTLDMSYRDETQGYCDEDKALDGGEYGFLSVTVHPLGGGLFTSSVNFGATVSGSAGLSFPDGDTLSFTPSSDRKSATAVVAVAADAGIVGPEAQLTLSYALAPLMQVEGVLPPSATVPMGVDVDFKRNLTTASFEQLAATAASWKTTFVGTGMGWTLDDYSAVSGSGRGWWVPVNQSVSDATLSPAAVTIGSAGLTLALSTTHEFPAGASGVIEAKLSSGGGWTTVATLTGDNGGMQTLQYNWGAELSGQKLSLRFRANSTGAVGAGFGWLIDNVSITGATQAPFLSEKAENNVCAE